MSTLSIESSGPPKKKENAALEVIKQAQSKALKGGLAGMSAQGINVLCFMWLRTTMNYQYRYGSGTVTALKTLWKEGGVPRFYRGLIPALIQSPVSRFGDTAANVGMLAFLESNENTKNLNIGIKTAAASFTAAGFRILLMPIDAWKTIKQVEGGDGLKALIAKVKTHGVSKLFHGSIAAMTATWVGHYPWFFTHNYLSKNLPPFEMPYGKLVRNASIGFCASFISDTCSNSIRVVKTTKQTSKVPLSYAATINEIVKKDGILGLFGRGLGTRILTNGCQGMVFSVGWKAIEDFLNKK